MDKKKKIIACAIILLVLLAFGLAWHFMNKQKPRTMEDVLRDLTAKTEGDLSALAEVIKNLTGPRENNENQAPEDIIKSLTAPDSK